MNKFDSFEFKKLKRISPSQFHSMKNCAYKSLLAEAFNKKSLLPLSPSAYLGTVLHTILELISKGLIRTEEEFKTKFDEEILLMEESLRRDGYEYFIPLQMNVRDYGIKKIQLKKHLREANESKKANEYRKFHSENWFESKDKSIGGKMDLIIEVGEKIEIIDFKTGAITEDIFDDEGDSYQAVKSEYQEQLKLYAYLYLDSTGKFPTELTLVDLAKQKFKVNFSEIECQKIFEEAKLLLKETNASIDSKDFKANPNEANCKFCLYRPACSFYLNLLKEVNYFNDVCGIIIDVVQYQNGKVSIFLIKESQKISIVGFEKDKFEYFKNNCNKQFTFFNLKKEDTFVYSSTKTTVIYE